jgi:hypothetical protein
MKACPNFAGALVLLGCCAYVFLSIHVTEVIKAHQRARVANFEQFDAQIYREEPPPPATTSAPADGAAGTLETYGFTQCPWMTLPMDERYPRVQSNKSPPSSMRKCIQHLVRLQEKGDIVFRIMEGQGIAAETSGHYHGNGDDDLDTRTHSRLATTKGPNNPYGLCRSPEAGDGVTDIGNFGFHQDPTTPNNTKAYQQMSQQPGGIVDMADGCNGYACSSCIGTWGGMQVLLSHPKDHYLRDINGASYWVPPVQVPPHVALPPA